jgi:hypothetical protein
MGEVINLRSLPVDLTSDVGHQFVIDCTRAAEGLLTDKELAEKYELSPKDWRDITKNRALGHAIRAERERRVRDGTAVREAAAKHLVKGPGILDGIMTGVDSHPKHKIEAYKELRQTASIGDNAERLPESARFIIRIDLTGDSGIEHVEHFDKERAPIKIDVSDGDVIPLEKKTDDDE